MRVILPIAACCTLALSACATRPPATELAPMPAAKPATAVAKNNRFDMSQNGRRMSAEDFDAWMKARGIRIAKGKPQPKSVESSKARRKP